MGRSEYMQHIVLLQRKRLTCVRGRYDQNIENCGFTVWSTFLCLYISSYSFLYVSVSWQTTRSFRGANRNLLTVACNCSLLVIILILIPAFSLSLVFSESTKHIITKLHTNKPHVSKMCTHYFKSLSVQPLRSYAHKRKQNRQTILIHISKTYYPNFNFNTSTGRSCHTVHFK